LPNLEIETYIDLKAPRLAQRFAEKTNNEATPDASETKKGSGGQKSEDVWTEEDVNYDASDW
jgi:hypothetical protein